MFVSFALPVAAVLIIISPAILSNMIKCIINDKSYFSEVMFLMVTNFVTLVSIYGILCLID